MGWWVISFFFLLCWSKEKKWYICSICFLFIYFFILRNLKEILGNEKLSFNFDIEIFVPCLDFFESFFESSLPNLALSRRGVVIPLEFIEWKCVNDCSFDGDHSFIVETFFSYFSEGLQWEQEESRGQKFGYESKVSLNLLASLARISFLRWGNIYWRWKGLEWTSLCGTEKKKDY